MTRHLAAWTSSDLGKFSRWCDDCDRLPTVDVMAVIVLTTSVTRQSPHTASKARHIRIKERNCADKLKGPERNKHGLMRKINKRTPRVKNLHRNNKRTTGAEDTNPTLPTGAPSFDSLVLRFTGMAGVHTPTRPGLTPGTKTRTSISK